MKNTRYALEEQGYAFEGLEGSSYAYPDQTTVIASHDLPVCPIRAEQFNSLCVSEKAEKFI